MYAAVYARLPALAFLTTLSPVVYIGTRRPELKASTDESAVPPGGGLESFDRSIGPSAGNRASTG
jgi:hypothetical protein